jgi:hypothetical protein
MWLMKLIFIICQAQLCSFQIFQMAPFVHSKLFQASMTLLETVDNGRKKVVFWLMKKFFTLENTSVNRQISQANWVLIPL